MNNFFLFYISVKAYRFCLSMVLVPKPFLRERIYFPFSLKLSIVLYSFGPGDNLFYSLNLALPEFILQSLVSPNFDSLNRPLFGSISTSL